MGTMVGIILNSLDKDDDLKLFYKDDEGKLYCLTYSQAIGIVGQGQKLYPVEQKDFTPAMKVLYGYTEGR